MIPTLFVGNQRQLIVSWDVVEYKSFPFELIPQYLSSELVEAYENVLEVLSLHFRKDFSLGLKLSRTCFHLLKNEHIYLSGESMGLAWLLGLALHHLKYRQKKLIMFSWGAIKPVRNGCFEFRPTNNTIQKIELATENSGTLIVTHRDEDVSSFTGAVLTVDDRIDSICDVLEEILNDDR